MRSASTVTRRGRTNPARRPAFRACASGLLLLIGAGCSKTDVPDNTTALHSSRAITADLDAMSPEIAGPVQAARATVLARPDDPRRWIALGMLYEANGPLALALPCYEEALALLREDAQVWYRIAMVHSGMARYAESIESLERVLAIDASYAPAHWRLGLARIERGELDAATVALQAALALDAADPAPWILLARVHLQREDAAAAITALQRALTLDPRNLYAHGLLGSALRLAGRLSEAEELLAMGAAVPAQFTDPWNAEVESHRVPTQQARILEARQLFAAGEVQRALAIVEKLLQDAPNDTTLLNYAGTCYANINRFDEARGVLLRSLEIEPGQRGTLLNLALLLEKAGEIEEALQTLDAALERSPTFARLHDVRGDMLMRRGELTEAVHAYSQALEYDQRGAETRMKLGGVELELRRWSDARATFEAVLARQPESGDAWVALAHAQTMLGELEAAEAALTRAGAAQVDDERRRRQVQNELRRRRDRAAANGGGL